MKMSASFRSKGHKVIVGGDFNMKPGDVTQRFPGQEPCKLQGSRNTFFRGGSATPIDHVVIHREHSKLITTAEVLRNIEIGEHFPIRVRISSDTLRCKVQR